MGKKIQQYAGDTGQGIMVRLAKTMRNRPMELGRTYCDCSGFRVGSPSEKYKTLLSPPRADEISASIFTPPRRVVSVLLASTFRTHFHLKFDDS